MRLLIGCLLLSFQAVAQRSGFILPLKGKVFLTGNYGEVRPNHFHAGLDFKTHAEDHLPVYAVADGYVSRIKVSTHGYGKALYITHANGLVSVYGHQYAFNETIRKYVEAAQIAQETFEIELFPKPKELFFKQGDIIGYTGNTGDSEGPHLHFELRDEKSEVPLNPLRFLPITDTIPPVLSVLALYEDDYTNPAIYKQKKKLDTVIVPTKLGIGIECYDLEQKGGNKNNIYKAELFLDGRLYYTHVLDSISFDLARYVNTYCDYELKKQKHIVIQKCFIGKNNDLPIYTTDKNKGFLMLSDTLYHELTVKVLDYFGQSAEMKITLKRKAATRMKPIVIQPLNCLKPYKNSTADYTVELPAKSLYRDVTMLDTFNNNTLFLFAKDYSVPLHKACALSVKVLPEFVKYGDKLCLAEFSGEPAYCGGTYENGYVTALVKNFGKFTVTMDTTAPKIKLNVSKKKKEFKPGEIASFKVSDDLSGIANFKVFVDGAFQLSEYDHKTGLIFFKLRDALTPGKIKINAEVYDKKANRASLQTFLLVH